MDMLEYELAGIVPVLLFFAFIWTAVLAGGILMIVLSARRKQKRLLGCGVVFLAIAVGIPLFGLLMFLSSVFGRRAACGANGISGTVLTGGDSCGGRCDRVHRGRDHVRSLPEKICDAGGSDVHRRGTRGV